MKFLKKHLDWIIFGLLATLIMTQRWPSYQANTAVEGSRLTPVSLTNTSHGGPLVFPPADKQPSVAIVWNTWCVPCKVEMVRIERAIQKGSLNGDRVFAINLGESVAAVQEHLKNKSYSFRVLIDSQGEVATQLKASVTPSIYLITANGEVSWASSGVGVSEVWRMERHLR